MSDSKRVRKPKSGVEHLAQHPGWKTPRQENKSGRRILSVTIRKIVDESPDTSYLGEYSNRPKSEYAIDRAHAEDCASLTPDFFCAPSDPSDWCYWNDSPSRILERVRTFLENFEADQDHWSSPNGCHEDCPACAEEDFYQNAVDAVWELEKNAGECDCHGGDMGPRELRYFNGPVENYKGESPENIRKYVRQDYERMERLNRGDWCYIGIRAEAEVVSGGVQGRTSNGSPVHTIQQIRSGGLWGIESDSDRSYLEEVQKDELASLKTELLALGFSKRAIATAFKNVEEKES